MSPVRELSIRGLKTHAVDVPMQRPLTTGGGVIKTAPLVLIDLHTKEGITGRSYVFCYTPMALKAVAQLLSSLGALIEGDSLVPAVIEQKLQQSFRLLGPQGLTGMAMGGIDTAVWDAPLASLLGGEPRKIPAYNSCGLGMIGSGRAADEARELVAPGFAALKIRLGYPELGADVEVVRAVRGSVGEDIHLMADYNQALSVAEARRRTSALDEEGLYWIEEPVRADDYSGHAQVRRRAKTAIQTGENWWGSHDMSKSIEAGAADYAMADAVKIGGVTGWLRAAALAESAGLPLSSHLYPEISAHLLTVSPTGHWLEYVDWANPILEEPLSIEDGQASASDAPGTGLRWNEDGIRRYSVK